MSEFAKRILAGMEEVLAIVRGEKKPSRVHLVHVQTKAGGPGAGKARKKTRSGVPRKRRRKP